MPFAVCTVLEAEVVPALLLSGIGNCRVVGSLHSCIGLLLSGYSFYFFLDCRAIGVGY